MNQKEFYSNDKGLKRDTNNKNSSGKSWMVKQKTGKKLNRVNITRLHDNLSKTTHQKQNDGANKYIEKMYKNSKNSQMFNGSAQKNAFQGKKSQTNFATESFPADVVTKAKTVAQVVEKLDFGKKNPIMERIIEDKNIFKLYNLMNNNYTEAARKINTKYLKDFGKELESKSQESKFKMEVLCEIAAFFSQFFVPTSKNTMGVIAKIQENEDKDNNED